MSIKAFTVLEAAEPKEPTTVPTSRKCITAFVLKLDILSKNSLIFDAWSSKNVENPSSEKLRGGSVGRGGRVGRFSGGSVGRGGRVGRFKGGNVGKDTGGRVDLADERVAENNGGSVGSFNGGSVGRVGNVGKRVDEEVCVGNNVNLTLFDGVVLSYPNNLLRVLFG